MGYLRRGNIAKMKWNGKKRPKKNEFPSHSRQSELLNVLKSELPFDDKREPFDRFRRLAQGIVNVPKAEADKKEAEWQKKQAAKKKRREK